MSDYDTTQEIERLNAVIADRNDEIDELEAELADLRASSVVVRRKCETCEGDPHKIDRWTCPDCDNNGWLLAEGVERYVECCDECHQAEPRYVIPARLIEGDT